jgi:hypothetical protein
MEIFKTCIFLSEKNYVLFTWPIFCFSDLKVLKACLSKESMNLGTVGSRSDLQYLQPFLITFRRRIVSPYPECRPNMKENRNCKMFGALRSLPPAANGNQASYTARRVQCIGVVMRLRNAFFCL